jgi:hemoglobin
VDVIRADGSDSAAFDGVLPLGRAARPLGRAARPLGGDLDDAGEVATFVRRFYAQVSRDDLLGPVFNQVAEVDWAAHLPKLTAFWCRALFGTPGYAGNPFAAHRRIHDREPFTPAHFERWLTLFHATLDLNWAGPNVNKMKALAGNVARVHSQQLIEVRSIGHQQARHPGGSTRRKDAKVLAPPDADSEGPHAQGASRLVR